MSQGLTTTPIIDYRSYVDLVTGGLETHQRAQSFSVRARLQKANGNFDNQVMLTEADTYGNMSDDSPVVQHALTQMDEWLTNLRADTSGNSVHVRLVRAKPADLVDACFAANDATKITESQVYTGNT
jgi:hypothetical protein